MPKNTTSATEIRTITIGDHTIRVGIKRGDGGPDTTPLLIFNGIGANLELLEPFTKQLKGVETIVFDIPGVGGSSDIRRPYRLRWLAELAAQMLDELGYKGKVDVLGVSWGGALAQQFAYTCSDRCRRLVLAATTPGIFMIPGCPSVLTKMASPRRYNDQAYMRGIASDIYGGEIRTNPALADTHAGKLQAPRWLGYFMQQLAFMGFSSLLWLSALKQPTLVVSGNDDPLVPLWNAKLLASLIPSAKLHVVDDGHLFLMAGSQPATPAIRQFLAAA